MKKIIYTILVGSLLLSGCGKTETNTLPPEVLKVQQAEEMQKRDQKRIENLHTVTYALAKYSQKYNTYPKVSDSWCAEDLIKTLTEETQLTKIQDPQALEVEGLSCPQSGIYYFFRNNNPDYYTFGIKLELDYNGNSYLTPQQIAEAPIESLQNVRLSEDGTRGDFYYIIGNYPIELLPQPTK